MVRVFANGKSQVESYQRFKKWYLMPPSLTLSIIRIRGKLEHSREWSSALPLHLGVVAIKKGPFGSPSTTVANFFLYTKNDQNTCLFITADYLPWYGVVCLLYLWMASILSDLVLQLAITIKQIFYEKSVNIIYFEPINIVEKSPSLTNYFVVSSFLTTW